MHAHRHLTNNYAGDARQVVQLPRRQLPSTGTFSTPIISKVHTREVIIDPDNSRVNMLEKKQEAMQGVIANRDGEIQTLKTQLAMLAQQNSLIAATLQQKLSLLEQDAVLKKTHIDNLSNIVTSVNTNLHEKTSILDSKLHNNHLIGLSNTSDQVQGLLSQISSLALTVQDKSAEIDGLKKSLHGAMAVNDGRVSNLMNTIRGLSSAVDTSKVHMESLVTNVNHIIATKEEEVDSLKTSLLRSASQMDNNAMLASMIQDLATSVNEKQLQLDELKKTVAELPATLSQINTLKVGDQTMIPKQPDAIKMNGVYKVAPLALAVNGGIVLHDIGYTDSKNVLPLCWDATTSRLLIKTGK